jgi:integrase
MASLKKRNLSWETLRKYDALLRRRLLPWCAERSYHVLDELTVPRMEDFRDTWQDSPAYAKANLARLRTFVQVCMDRDWIGRNPAKALRAPQVRALPTLPFSAEEMACILAACDKYRGDKHRMRAFVLTMRYWGLGISDTIALVPEQLIEHRLRLYTTKTAEPVCIPLPSFVVDALKRIERPGHRYFSTGNAKPGGARANWSRYLTSIFRIAQIENGHSHRLRDTFSTSLPERGVSVEIVAMLLGTTPAVVIKHYAPWIKSRQMALEAAVRETWQSPTSIAGANVAKPEASEGTIIDPVEVTGLHMSNEASG